MSDEDARFCLGEDELIVRIGTPDGRVVAHVTEQDTYGISALHRSGAEIGTIVDIGAQIGSFTAWALRHWPDARVLSVDSDPAAFGQLARNMSIRKGVTIMHVALSDWDGQGYLLPGRVAGKMVDGKPVLALALQVDDSTPDRKRLTVRSTPAVIREWLSDDSERVDLLKIDCEGSEWVILDALRREGMMRRIGHIRGEWHWATPDRPQAESRLLDALGETHRVTVTGGKDYGLGLFVADPLSRLLEERAA